ncbi:LuxR C-terminal-related transcriptional regulator [Mycolicibacterium septicum]|uniref:LuxR C-terminal-related transcriptional regulator n=1 Tax=Mycolicibacterium septicum TaxID=98668 RepID=UPI003D336811
MDACPAWSAALAAQGGVAAVEADSMRDSNELIHRYAPGTGRPSSHARSLSNRIDAAVNWGVPTIAGARVEMFEEEANSSGLHRDARILIIDDCMLSRDNLAAVLSSQGGGVPGVAWDLASLITAFETSLPQVILLNTETRDSANLLTHAMKLGPQARVVVLGVSEEDESRIVACAEAGVAGYHMRTESLAQLLVLIHKVASGESICPPRVSAILLRRLSALASQRRSAVKELVLTAREIQILRMLELGLANQAIADELCIAVHTVKNHVHNLLSKLGVSTRAQAAALGRTMPYTSDPPGI